MCDNRDRPLLSRALDWLLQKTDVPRWFLLLLAWITLSTTIPRGLERYMIPVTLILVIVATYDVIRKLHQ